MSRRSPSSSFSENFWVKSLWIFRVILTPKVWLFPLIKAIRPLWAFNVLWAELSNRLSNSPTSIAEFIFSMASLRAVIIARECSSSLLRCSSSVKRAWFWRRRSIWLKARSITLKSISDVSIGRTMKSKAPNLSACNRLKDDALWVMSMTSVSGWCFFTSCSR